MSDEITDVQIHHDRIHELVHLLLNQVVPSKTNPRESMDKEPFLELKKAIASAGLQTPISVRPQGERYEIVGGHRRYRAFCELADEHPEDPRFKRIPAVVRVDEPQNIHLLQLLDNLGREDLKPLEIARSIAGLMEQGMGMESVAAYLGWPTRRAYKYLQLHKAPAWLKELMNRVDVPKDDAAGEMVALPGLSFTDWLELVALYNQLHDLDVEQLKQKGGNYAPRAEKVVIELAQRAAREKWSSAEVRAAVKAVKSPGPTPAASTRLAAKKPPFVVNDRHIAIDVVRVQKLTSAQREQLAIELGAQLRALGFSATIKADTPR